MKYRSLQTLEKPNLAKFMPCARYVNLPVFCSSNFFIFDSMMTFLFKSLESITRDLVDVKEVAIHSSKSSFTTLKKINANTKRQLHNGLSLMIAGANLLVCLVRNKYFVTLIVVFRSNN